MYKGLKDTNRGLCGLYLIRTCESKSLYCILVLNSRLLRTPVVPYGAETCATHDGGVMDGRTLTSSKSSAGMCAIGMGPYSIAPIGGVYIGPMGSCAGLAMGAGDGGIGGCGVAVSSLLYPCLDMRINDSVIGRLRRGKHGYRIHINYDSQTSTLQGCGGTSRCMCYSILP